MKFNASQMFGIIYFQFLCCSRAPLTCDVTLLFSLYFNFRKISSIFNASTWIQKTGLSIPILLPYLLHCTWLFFARTDTSMRFLLIWYFYAQKTGLPLFYSLRMLPSPYFWKNNFRISDPMFCYNQNNDITVLSLLFS